MTTVSIAAWNALGSGMSGGSDIAKGYATTWDALIGRFLSKICERLPLSATNFVLGMMCESGVPPASTPITFPLHTDTIIGGSISARYQWYGWNKSEGSDQYRCSLGVLQAIPNGATPSDYPFCTFGAPPIDLNTAVAFTTPVVTRPMGYAFFMPVLGIVIAIVHLPSGPAQRNLNVKILQQLTTFLNATWHGVPIILVGDMNMDILGIDSPTVMLELSTLKKATYPPTTIAAWNLLRTDEITQRSGGELDWGLACGCAADVHILGGLKDLSTSRGIAYIAEGVSDHAMLGYTVSI